jgi:hypothetical protein
VKAKIPRANRNAGTPCIHSQDATWQYVFTSVLIASLIPPLKRNGSKAAATSPRLTTSKANEVKTIYLAITEFQTVNFTS